MMHYTFAEQPQPNSDRLSASSAGLHANWRPSRLAHLGVCAIFAELSEHQKRCPHTGSARIEPRTADSARGVEPSFEDGQL
jgi:hypothetical protein